jgi:hypothetical protein
MKKNHKGPPKERTTNPELKAAGERARKQFKEAFGEVIEEQIKNFIASFKPVEKLE